ncbi:hypothetical protein CJ030_MR5G022406 [Morella rubra]|uniref:PUM-HD domain-containing protein n=1 Tax=Morella rubra TaxID=262757 RepID=A0A6A1VK02_9ROSI|nr:hypothetical protein CJ030_MR5G022406 [Morella rubra]
MATESPMAMVESSRVGEWPSSKHAAAFEFPLKNMAAEQSGMLLMGQRCIGDQADIIPNRSGSAPPNMEGSLASIKNLLMQHSSRLNSSLANLGSSIESCVPEEQVRSDPAYFAYYTSNINLNPRLPPPLISQENRRLLHQIGVFGNNWELTSAEDSGSGSLHLSGGSLSAHKQECEDDTSSRVASDNLAESSTAPMPGQDTISLSSRHKSLVDLIQEDFPRTPSPVYNQSRSSGHATIEEACDSDVYAISLNVSSVEASKLAKSNTCSTDELSEVYPLDAPASEVTYDSSPSGTSFRTSRCLDGRGSSPIPEHNELNNKDADFKDDVSISGALGPDVSGMDIQTKASNGESDSKKQEKQLSYKRNTVQHDLATQWGVSYQVQGFQAQVSCQEMNHSHGVIEKVPHSHPNCSSGVLQPALHSSGLTPPLYATAATYMTSGNPYYTNFYSSGFFSPQYSVGGYALSSAHLPPYVAAYHSPGVIPLPFDATSAPSFSGQTAGSSTGEGIPFAGDVQHIGKFYGQHGLMLQPSFVDPHHMLYYPHPLGNAYSSAYHSQLTSIGGVGGQINTFALQNESTVASYNQKLQSPTNGSFSNLSPRKVGTTSSSYFPNPPDLDVMTRYPASPLPSPLLTSSPEGGMSRRGQRSEMRLPPASIRNGGLYSGWQGQRGLNSFEEPKRPSLLEELKSSNARSVDQHGSRFIQQKLEQCSVEDKESVFKEVLPHASKLMIDVFGNYVIQKFFEHGNLGQRKEFADQLAGQMLSLSLQMYGCRVIQKGKKKREACTFPPLKRGEEAEKNSVSFVSSLRSGEYMVAVSFVNDVTNRWGISWDKEGICLTALEVIELDQKIQLVHELDGHVMRCVRDQNGNHVIQKCIECVPVEKIGFIVSAFQGQVATLATHPYGCRVIQRVLEHCSDELQIQCIVEEILESACVLSQDQYGNYVTQHVLEMGKSHARTRIIKSFTGAVVQMSQHKYASNVVEKCLEYGDTAERELLIEEIIGHSEDNENLLFYIVILLGLIVLCNEAMVKDQFANYVVQKILETSNDRQREILLNRIRVHLHALKKYTYGKHIVARFEQLSGEGNGMKGVLGSAHIYRPLPPKTTQKEQRQCYIAKVHHRYTDKGSINGTQIRINDIKMSLSVYRK